MAFASTLQRFHLARKLFLGAACCIFLGASSCFALDILRIEEHWELKVGGPDGGRCAPQVSMVMAPTGNLDCNYFVFSLNHWSYPNFVPGGLELQRWHGDEWVSSHQSSHNSPLSIDGETVSWVQSLEIVESQLHFTISNGQSQTWGQFGGQGLLKNSFATELTRLNGYQPEISFSGSGISYAGNRVSSLTLTKLVWVTSDGEEHQMLAPIDIHTDIDP